MTPDEIKKLEEAVTWIQLSLDNQDGGWRAEHGVRIIDKLIEEAKAHQK